MAYTQKRYTKINWKNRPSTSTALGAKNLNHMDLFLNEVDDTLIEFEARKLNISVANSMISTVAYDKEHGIWTFTQLDGTTYQFDQNIEKIPVSFSLSEDGVLTMVTEDGTTYEANIADAMREYVFDNTETIAASKEYNNEDSSYHVNLEVKKGSIKREHLAEDYFPDVQALANEAKAAAADSLLYSKDSKRYAVGDREFPGSENDNAKIYKEQAEAAKIAAEQARDDAQAVANVEIMKPDVAGIGKPDNVTIGVDNTGTFGLIAGASQIKANDTEGIVNETPGETNIQALVDSLARKLMEQIEAGMDLTEALESMVTKDMLSNELLKYVQESMLSTSNVNDSEKIPVSSVLFGINQGIEQSISEITQNISDMNGEIETLKESETVKIISRFTIAASAWVNKQYTLSNDLITDADTICDVYVNNASLDVFNKAKITGETSTGKLILTCKMVPTAAINIDCVKVVG